MDKRLRWMEENVNGAYNARHPKGHPKAGDYCTNSGTCIIVCCYINALGKVLLKGGPAKQKNVRTDFMRFKEFLRLCMSDFMIESSTKSWTKTPRGKAPTGDEWLYEVFRCGFIHGYPNVDVAWGRKPNLNKYWYDHRGRLTLNIDELVKGFLRGIEEFRRLATADTDLRSNFIQYITKNV
jgi:hypothetical protein